MKTIQLFLCVSLLVSGFTSCKTSSILSSKFESETIGSLPQKDIPGAPSGDEITYSTELQPRIKVTASSFAGQKAVTFSEADASGLTAHNQFLAFRGISTNFSEPLWFVFNGSHSGKGERLLIEIADGSAGMITRMFLDENGRLSQMKGFTGADEVIGTIPPGTSHTFIVNVDMNAKKFNLSVLQQSGNILIKDQPLLLGNPLSYANPAHPTIAFRWEDGNSPSRKYVIEEVFISRKKPAN